MCEMYSEIDIDEKNLALMSRFSSSYMLLNNAHN